MSASNPRWFFPISTGLCHGFRGGKYWLTGRQAEVDMLQFLLTFRSWLVVLLRNQFCFTQLHIATRKNLATREQQVLQSVKCLVGLEIECITWQHESDEFLGNAKPHITHQLHRKLIYTFSLRPPRHGQHIDHDLAYSLCECCQKLIWAARRDRKPHSAIDSL